MFTNHFQHRFIAVAFGLVLLLVVSGARADPPARVARLGYISGQVSFSPAGETDWVQATLNRPLTTGDRLWADANALAELQIGGAAIRLGASTNLMVINLDDKMIQVQLLQGSLKIRVRQMARDQSFEVDTPNLAFSLHQAGDYRVDVNPSGAETAVKVNLGRAEAYGDSASYTVEAGQAYRFYGTGLSDYEQIPAASDDDLDRWSNEREARAANSDSARYVSYEVVGYEDLDTFGSWRFDPSYGNVWLPNQLQADWAPYRNGHWTWIDPWGWNWVDDAPWGYAVSHYGRWAHLNGYWGWVPGPRHEQAVFAPALVVFLGGKNFQSSRSVDDGDRAIGWFPLAPREVYQPAYQVSRAYFDRVNRSNAVIASTTLINVYQTSVTNTINTVTDAPKVVYVNQRLAGAVVAMPMRAFTHSQPVAKAELVVSEEAANRGDLTPIAAIAPTAQSRQGGAPEARAKPPSHEGRIIARTASPVSVQAFAAHPAQLIERQGTPIDDQQRKQVKSRGQSEAIRSVTAVPIAQAPSPPAGPPTVAPKARVQAEPKADASKSFPIGGDTARKPVSQIPTVNLERERANAVKANWAREEAAKAELVRAATAKAAGEKVNAAKSATTKGVEPAHTPYARSSEPGSVHKQTREVL